MFDESLSALLDGELDSAETQHLLDRMKRDPALREAWTRQHLLRAALRRQLPKARAGDIAAQVAARLQSEMTSSKVVDLTARLRCAAELPASPQQVVVEPVAELAGVAAVRRRPRPWALGLGLAASLAAVSVIALQSARFWAPEAAPVQVAGDRPLSWSGVSSETAQELNDYLLDHHRAADSTIGSMPAHARLATAGLQNAAYER